MLTMIILFCVLLVFGMVVAILSGIIAIAPWLMAIFILPIVDVFILKWIFSRKKKK